MSEELLLGTFTHGDHVLADVIEDDKIGFKKIDPEEGTAPEKELVVN